MPNQSTSRVTDNDIISSIEQRGILGTARHFGLTERGIYSRRAAIEARIGRQISVPDKKRTTRRAEPHPGRINLDIENGTVLVASDAHYWPGKPSVAHRAFVKFCKEEKPAVAVMNGDVIDGATVSRHPPIGWTHRPKFIEEIEEAARRLLEIRTALPRKSQTIWSLGNHDARLETRIATVLPELAALTGTQLRDHFGDEWKSCWSVWVNEHTIIKHRFKGGIHAPHNNTMWAGKSIITGHLHSLKVTPFDDYNGTRWGVDCGCLADTFGGQFGYMEDNPRNWRAGFVKLTFKNGRLLWPEICSVHDETHVDFRGALIKV